MSDTMSNSLRFPPGVDMRFINIAQEIRLRQEESIRKMSNIPDGCSHNNFHKTHRRQYSVHVWNFETTAVSAAPVAIKANGSYRKKSKVNPEVTVQPLPIPPKRSFFASLFNCFKREPVLPPYRPTNL